MRNFGYRYTRARANLYGPLVHPLLSHRDERVHDVFYVYERTALFAGTPHNKGFIRVIDRLTNERRYNLGAIRRQLTTRPKNVVQAQNSDVQQSFLLRQSAFVLTHELAPTIRRL